MIVFRMLQLAHVRSVLLQQFLYVYGGLASQLLEP